MRERVLSAQKSLLEQVPDGKGLGQAFAAGDSGRSPDAEKGTLEVILGHKCLKHFLAKGQIGKIVLGKRGGFKTGKLGREGESGSEGAGSRQMMAVLEPMTPDQGWHWLQ